MNEACLENLGLKGIQLRSYQLDGINWFIKCIKNNHGGILADEMGLGKTIQSICAILSFRSLFNFEKYIIVSPLSVIDNWKNELTKFAPNLPFLIYIGSKDQRSKLRSLPGWISPQIILITTYEYLILEFHEISTLSFDVLIMDEGHRIKNCDSLLHQKVAEMDVKYRFLLTGTPIQNNLDELYNLLEITSSKGSDSFLPSRDAFKSKLHSKLLQADITGVLDSDPVLSRLVLRRTKAEVLPTLPEQSEIVIFHGLSPTQKSFYKSILEKNSTPFKNDSDSITLGSETRLLNVLTQLRKCVLHPYLFQGVEPEPFELGEHLVDQSMKLNLLDRLLSYLIPLGHKILIFSQMTKMLDIIQDYCFLRGHNYERLDGSVRSEERFAAVAKFCTDSDTKLFLLSTRAGGQGLNLTAADTVIFVDSDFNPQVDLQAMARVHRPGQLKPCRTIRLVTKHSVEEMIVFRAQQKLHMTRGVLGHEDAPADNKKMNIREMVCYGLHELLSEDSVESAGSQSALSDEFFTAILGPTNQAGCWQPIESVCDRRPDKDSVDSIDHMYLFEGQDYKCQTSNSDYQAAISLAADTDTDTTHRPASRATGTMTAVVSSTQSGAGNGTRKISQRKLQMWSDNHYSSCRITTPDTVVMADLAPPQTTSGIDLADDKTINFVVGDVTCPVGDSAQLKIICHLVDNSGSWGHGGLFSALDRINSALSVNYLQASEMEDLKLGDVHIFPLQTNVQVALLVAQSRDNVGSLSPVKMNHLSTCFLTVAAFAIEHKASIHLTRLGYKTPKFNWYGIEKLIEKHFVEKSLDTYIYYLRRGLKRPASNVPDKKLSEIYWKSVLTNLVIHFHESIDSGISKTLRKHVYALDGEVTDNPFDDRITHVIISDSQTVSVDRAADREISYLPLDWLIQSIQNNCLMPEIDFSI